MEVLVLRTWSRPKYIIGNIYLTIAARKMDMSDYVPMTAWKARLSKIAGNILFQLFTRGPVGRLNRSIAQRAWPLTEAGNREIARILSQVDR
jgi:hypothetical protein